MLLGSNNIQLSEEQLAAIEEMAGHGFSYSDIGLVIGTDQQNSNEVIDALNNQTHEANRSFMKGFLKSQLELRQRIFIDAKNGSSPAQALAKKILDDAEFKMNA
jgi:hypothetical protein